SDAAEKDCPLVGPETASTATNYITYVVTVKPTTTGQTAENIPETQNYEVKVPPKHDVNIIEKVVALCSPPPTSDPSRSPPQKVIPAKTQGKGLVDSGVPKVAPNSPESPSHDGEPITTKGHNRQTQEGAELQRDGTKSLDTATSREKLNGARTSEEKESSASTEVAPPTSSEAESKETENSATVKEADHTPPTATPQSETTTEEASNTDAGTPTSAGEGAKLPDRNTDASSSSTAWVRAPLLLLLAGVAVW
ncbi:hypothetical protein DQ04_23511000, partial [Trypanosoma grayi]|uniref:hypothetical protein n=1 Tax=Trypanosoma grayi TaxID=71804 RepID=UPI0004F4BCC4